MRDNINRSKKTMGVYFAEGLPNTSEKRFRLLFLNLNLLPIVIIVYFSET